MFTGIVEEVGTVKSLTPRKIAVSATEMVKGTRLGDSIAVNGACLTVVDLDDNAFSVDIMPETLRRTNLGALRAGDPVNLERAMPVGGRFGGHFVQGHVDGPGKVATLASEQEAIIMKIEAPPEIMRYIVEKGFVGVDGVSLTVVGCNARSFQVSLVSFTRTHTTLGRKKIGNMVNLEIDILAKYVERLAGKNKSGIDSGFLAEHGFLG